MLLHSSIFDLSYHSSKFSFFKIATPHHSINIVIPSNKKA
ncbi:hypothetical protein AAZX31_02G219200 [Glycine max]